MTNRILVVDYRRRAGLSAGELDEIEGLNRQ
jgi:hypothetical protein